MGGEYYHQQQCEGSRYSSNVRGLDIHNVNIETLHIDTHNVNIETPLIAAVFSIFTHIRQQLPRTYCAHTQTCPRTAHTLLHQHVRVKSSINDSHTLGSNSQKPCGTFLSSLCGRFVRQHVSMSKRTKHVKIEQQSTYIWDSQYDYEYESPLEILGSDFLSRHFGVKIRQQKSILFENIEL